MWKRGDLLHQFHGVLLVPLSIIAYGCTSLGKAMRGLLRIMAHKQLVAKFLPLCCRTMA
jgi:hypothetical protein